MGILLLIILLYFYLSTRLEYFETCKKENVLVVSCSVLRTSDIFQMSVFVLINKKDTFAELSSQVAGATAHSDYFFTFFIKLLFNQAS